MAGPNYMDAKNIKPLCLSFRSPPTTRPQAILIGKMIPEWLAQDLKPVIITYDNNGDWDINVPIYKIHGLQLNKFLYRIPQLRAALEQRYYQKTFDIAAQVVQRHNINLVFSFANPPDSNIVGAMLRKKLGIKFISHFSDPWYDSPYNKFSGSTARRILALESFIIENSDRIIFTNNQAKELVMQKYPTAWHKKAKVIPHCYDLRDYPEIAKEKTSHKFLFSHIGAFNKCRKPDALFKAFSNLLKKSELRETEFKLRLVGATGNYADYSKGDLEHSIGACGLSDIVESVPPVTYKESLRQMKLADCLIVMDADFKKSPFLPSKVIDYAASGTIIVGITPHNSPTADFLANLGCPHFNYSQVEELADCLERLILNQVTITFDKNYLKRFDVKETTSQLIQQFNEVVI